MKNKIKEKEFVIKNPTLINPFFYYVICWCLTFFLYFISPSQLNTSLNLFLICFLVATIIISFFFAIRFNAKYKNKKYKIKSRKKNIMFYLVILSLLTCEFIYSHNIPLISSLQGIDSNYQDFGIPTLHVILVTITLLMCINAFLRFKLFKEKKDLFIFLIFFGYFMLVFSRGMMLLILLCILCLYLVDKNIRVKYVLYTICIVIVLCWGFGILGNLRVSGKWNNSEIILSMGKIDENPYSLLSPFYWAEEYIICSLRNLNYNIENLTPTYSINDLLYVTLPDFISKRIMNNNVIYVKRLVGYFTSLTTYSLHYSAFGYLGMIFEFLNYLLIGIVLDNFKFSNAIYKFSILAIASILFGLSIFDAMLQYSGYSFVLVWGLIGGSYIITKRNNSIVLKKDSIGE